MTSEAALLKDILSRWHVWASGYQANAGRTACAMFSNAKTPNHWQTADSVTDEQIDANGLRAVDFQVSEMEEPYKSAIYEYARNCYTGHSVWRSPRLPADREARIMVLAEAKAQISERLINAGVL